MRIRTLSGFAALHVIGPFFGCMQLHGWQSSTLAWTWQVRGTVPSKKHKQHISLDLAAGAREKQHHVRVPIIARVNEARVALFFSAGRHISLDLPRGFVYPMGTRLLRTASKRTVSLAQKANQYP